MFDFGFWVYVSCRIDFVCMVDEEFINIVEIISG